MNFLNIKKYTAIALLHLVTACSSVTEPEQIAIADSPTHPKVSTKPYQRSESEPMPGEAKFRPIRVEEMIAVKVPTGSLFDERRAIGLFQPSIKYRIGDMILVKLDEKTSAKKSLDFKKDKKTQFTLEPVSLYAGPIALDGSKLNADYSQGNDFDASSQTMQDNSLNGDITVYVTDVTQNGSLIIAGEKWISLNSGDEYIRFSGEVRVKDIANDNSIASVKVGNARIEYGGKGRLHDNQQSTLIDKIFSILE